MCFYVSLSFFAKNFSYRHLHKYLTIQNTTSIMLRMLMPVNSPRVPPVKTKKISSNCRFADIYQKKRVYQRS